MEVLCPIRNVVPDGSAAGQTHSSAARVQEETSGSHRYVELRCQGTRTEQGNTRDTRARSAGAINQVQHNQDRAT